MTSVIGNKQTISAKWSAADKEPRQESFLWHLLTEAEAEAFPLKGFCLFFSNPTSRVGTIKRMYKINFKWNLHQCFVISFEINLQLTFYFEMAIQLFLFYKTTDLCIHTHISMYIFINQVPKKSQKDISWANISFSGLGISTAMWGKSHDACDFFLTIDFPMMAKKNRIIWKLNYKVRCTSVIHQGYRS